MSSAGVSAAAEFVDNALQRESTWERATEYEAHLGGGNNSMRFYGASVGAVRASIRDLQRRHPHLSHDEVTALSSELWLPPVYERRLAAIVLLQGALPLLKNSDLTRLEGFLRDSHSAALADPLIRDVIAPLVAGLDPAHRAKADVALDRWTGDANAWLRQAATLGRAWGR